MCKEKIYYKNMGDKKDVGTERAKETEHNKHYSHSSVLTKIEITSRAKMPLSQRGCLVSREPERYA